MSDIQEDTIVTPSGFEWEDVEWRYLAYRLDSEGKIIAYAYAPTCDEALSELATIDA